MTTRVMEPIRKRLDIDRDYNLSLKSDIFPIESTLQNC
jgi:hypothetical protein